jgi:Lanthionine synthetase C-like protein
VLYRPADFEALTDDPWDEGRVRDAVRGIVADADAAFDPDGLWPAHEWDGWQTKLPLKNLYVGAAGVLWALDALRRLGHAETQVDLAAAALRALELWRAEQDFIEDLARPEPAESALFLGESGVLLVACRLAPGPQLTDDLLARVRANVANEAEELFWGAPGTLLAAAAMRDWSGEERWEAAARETAQALAGRRDGDGLWTQRLYGNEFRSLGAPHGLVGNVAALLRVEDERNGALMQDTAALLARAAVLEDGLATWPLADGRGLVALDGEIRLQWCGGAPGIVIAAAPYLDEELLLAGAELVWQAGPHSLEKGAGICHGTAGNGYALLKAFARTGDERWLERARRFAVHALAQVERLRAANGGGRYALWTGDVGVALFAASCLAADARYPVLD